MGILIAMKHTIILAAILAACAPSTPIDDPSPAPTGLDCVGEIVLCQTIDDVGLQTRASDGSCFECVEVNVPDLPVAWTRVAPCSIE